MQGLHSPVDEFKPPAAGLREPRMHRVASWTKPQVIECPAEMDLTRGATPGLPLPSPPLSNPLLYSAMNVMMVGRSDGERIVSDRNSLLIAHSKSL